MPKFIVLCGKTGSGKTSLLHQLSRHNYTCINLEVIASHRGSAFGNMLLPQQPSQKIFEQQLQETFNQITNRNYVFVEQKASSIGKRKIPEWFYSKMNEGIFVELNAAKKIRIKNILNEYGNAGKENFMNALCKLKERLPIFFFEEAQAFLQQENYYAFIKKMLDYYDNTSKYNLLIPTIIINVETNDYLQTMQELLKTLEEQKIVIS